MATECGTGLLGGAKSGFSGSLMVLEAPGEPENERLRLEKLVQENIGWLRGWLRGRVRDSESIDDLSQESFLRAFREIRRLRDPSRFPSWLYRIALNVLRDHLRKETRRRALISYTDQIEDQKSQAVDEEDPVRKEAAADLLNAIRELPERLREPLLLRHSRNLPYKQIAAILGIRENTVQVRIFRARRLLRKKFEPRIEEP
jgi:RNA polymerase sigma factor (sigma-70 family)